MASNKITHCMCESELCDHGGLLSIYSDWQPCTRPVDDCYCMEYVVHTCRRCAENMIASGGASLIWVNGVRADKCKVRTPTTPAHIPQA